MLLKNNNNKKKQKKLNFAPHFIVHTWCKRERARNLHLALESQKQCLRFVAADSSSCGSLLVFAFCARKIFKTFVIKYSTSVQLSLDEFT